MLPWFGFKEPNKEYYLSNLHFHFKVFSCCSTGINYIIMFDERTMGKGADSLCSLRINHFQHQYSQFKAAGKKFPESFFGHLDNCVGQNKSQFVMKFFCMLSLVCFKVVKVDFLITGHSHMAADRYATFYSKIFIKKLKTSLK